MSSDRPNAAPSSPPERAPGTSPRCCACAAAPLVEALERHLPGAREHADGTASYAFVAAVALGFDRAQCEVAREAATPARDRPRLRAGRGRRQARARARRSRDAAFDAHYEAGYRLARGAGIPERVCGWLLRARERFDGRGPEGLAGGRIPIESRLIRAACVCQTALARPGLRASARRSGSRSSAARQAAGGARPQVVAALHGVLERAARRRTSSP